MSSQRELAPFLGLLDRSDLLFANTLVSPQEACRKPLLALLALLMRQSRHANLLLDLNAPRPADFYKVASSQRPLYQTLYSLAKEGQERAKKMPWCSQAPDPDLYNPVIEWNGRFYLQRHWIEEERIVEGIKRQLSTAANCPSVSAEMIALVTRTEGLDPLQQEALRLFLEKPFLLLTGGPGTGKTFVATKMATLFATMVPARKEPIRIRVVAPTGRAAAHLGRSIQAALFDYPEIEIKNSTIDALVYRPPYWHKNTPLLSSAFTCDLLFVEESSMIPSSLFSRLFEAGRQIAKVVLLGDPGQLPPIGAGAIFADLVSLAAQKNIPAIQLETIKRSNVAQIHNLAAFVASDATKMAQNMAPISLISLPEKMDDFYSACFLFFIQGGLAYYKEHPVDWKWQKVEKAILTFFRQGPFGSEAINQHCHALSRASAIKAGAPFLLVPLMITQNSPHLGLSNGDIGWLWEFFSGGSWIATEAFFEATGAIAVGSLPPHTISYALSVHKSQGAEFRDVLLVIAPDTAHFGKSALYTAITRAKSSITIYAGRDDFLAMCKTESPKNSSLKERVFS